MQYKYGICLVLSGPSFTAIVDNVISPQLNIVRAQNFYRLRLTPQIPVHNGARLIIAERTETVEMLAALSGIGPRMLRRVCAIRTHRLPVCC